MCTTPGCFMYTAARLLPAAQNPSIAPDNSSLQHNSTALQLPRGHGLCPAYGDGHASKGRVRNQWQPSRSSPRKPLVFNCRPTPQQCGHAKARQCGGPPRQGATDASCEKHHATVTLLLPVPLPPPCPAGRQAAGCRRQRRNAIKQNNDCRVHCRGHHPLHPALNAGSAARP